MVRTVLAALVLCGALAAGAYWMWGDDTSNAGLTFALLSPDEIGEMDPAEPATQAQKQRALKVTNASGPGITVAAPSGFMLKSPVDFDIRLEPRDGVAVDMKSLRIDYRLGPVWVNLTGRIMKEATIKGSRLMARGAELPPGNHILRLTAQDAQMRTTRATVTFSVSK